MTKEEIAQIIKNSLSDCDILVNEQHGQYIIQAIGDRFRSMSPIERQKSIYAPILEYITQGKIHAVTVKGYSKEEWDKIQNKSQN